MVDISILTMVYKPTSIPGGHHFVFLMDVNNENMEAGPSSPKDFG